MERNALAEAYLAKGRETRQDEFFAEARRLLEESLALMPKNNGGAQLLLAEVAESHHDFRTAIRLAEEAVRNGADPRESKAVMVGAYLESGQVESAAQLAGQLLEGANTPGPLVLMARVEAARGKDDQAIDLFRQAIALEQPGDRAQSARMRALLGRIHARRGRYEEAVELYRESLKIQSDLIFAVDLWADLELELGRDQKAEELYHRSFSQAPHPVPLMGLASLRVRQGDRDAAEAFWSRAENLLMDHLHGDGQDHGHSHSHGNSHSHSHSGTEDENPEGFGTGHGRDLAMLLLARGEPQDLALSVKVMEDELQIRRDVKTLDALGESYAAAGLWDQAVDAYQQALDTGFLEAGLYLRAAEAYQQTGQVDRAEGLRQKAKVINPRKVLTHGAKDPKEPHSREP